jgi:hypothetical protein
MPDNAERETRQRHASAKNRSNSSGSGKAQRLGAAMHQSGSEHHAIGPHGLDRHMHQSEDGYNHPLDNKFLGGFMKQR